MARVSRKKQNLPTPAVDTPIRRWKTALYVRLSVEDNGKGSDSIENQTTLLEDYIASRSYLEKTALFVDATVIIGLKQNPTYGRRFSPIFLFIRAFCGAKRKMLL